MTRRVVYTALFGAHEQLHEQPVAAHSDVRFLCFTDNTELTSSSWEIIPTTPLFPADPRRSQRDIKIRGHQVLHEFDQWLYIDNTVELSVSPEEICDQWLVDADWAAIAHDAHATTWEEFDANLAANKDSPERINEQLQDYSLHSPDVLDSRPLWNGFFVRANNERVQAFTDLWFHHVCRYSARDQLSIMVALQQRPVRVNVLESQVRKSPWHTWPHRDGETETSKALRHAKSSGLKPLAEELHQARSQIELLQDTLQTERDKRFLGLAGLKRKIDDRRRARRRKRKQAKKRS